MGGPSNHRLVSYGTAQKTTKRKNGHGIRLCQKALEMVFFGRLGTWDKRCVERALEMDWKFDQGDGGKPLL